MKHIQLELNLEPVTEKSTQPVDAIGAKARKIAEPTVWTDSMCVTLEKGVKGGKWHTLYDKVFMPAALLRAAEKVLSNKGSAGVDHVSTEHFKENLDGNIAKIYEGLRTRKYVPQSIRRVMIPKGGSNEKRPLGIPTVRDRVVQTSLLQVLEPIFEIDFAEHSYGFRPNRGAKDALRRVDSQLKSGFTFVVDADLKGYFDSIPHEKIIAGVKKKVSDNAILNLVQQMLVQPIETDGQLVTPTKGTPQGAVISPLLANIMLDPLDKLMVESGFEMTRYADDFVILCKSREAAESALRLVQQWVNDAGLQLHPEKTHIAEIDAGGSFEFLGYRFERAKNGSIRRYVREKSKKKFRDTIRQKTRRLRGGSLKVIIDDLNLTLRGWFDYFKHAWETTFPGIDGFVRRRLRRILRKRDKKSGGTGQNYDDHKRWPNRFFDESGLYSTQRAYDQIMHPPRR